jgi:inositol transporter-like SP family MFS transporter
VPTSLALVGEIAPAKSRGKLISLTQVAWGLGPAVVLILAFALDPLKLTGVRIVFFHLFVVAVVTWALRQGLAESAVWKAASEKTATSVRRLGSLFRGNNLKALAYTGLFYIFWALAAGTAGIFTPFIVESLHAGSRATALAISMAGFIIGLPTVLFIVMRKIDTSHRARKTMMATGIILQVVAYGMFLVLPFTIVTASVNVLLFNIGTAIAGEPFYKTFSQELFPTLLRGTAQGFTFGAARLLLGAWSFFVPVLATAGIKPVAGLLALFLAIAGAVGYFAMPDTVGRPLTEIEAERSEVATQ